MRLTNKERITAANALRDYAYNLRQAERRMGMTGTLQSETLDMLARKLRPRSAWDKLAAKRDAEERSTYASDTRRGELSDDLGESPDY